MMSAFEDDEVRKDERTRREGWTQHLYDFARGEIENQRQLDNESGHQTRPWSPAF